MATVDMTAGGSLHPTRSGNTSLPYMVEFDLDLADVVTEKGSAIATGDVVEMMDVPADTLVLAAGLSVVTADSTAVSVTATLGDGSDVDRYAAGFDMAGSAGADSTVVAANVPFFYGSADTVDLVITVTTTAPSDGVYRVWAILQDVSDRKNGGIVALGS